MEALLVEGPDARDFLHRITSVNFLNLQPGDSPVEGCLLNPQGRILVYFTASCEGPERFLLATPQPFPNVHAHFDKFHFGEKLKLSKASVPAPASVPEVERVRAGKPAYPAEINETVMPLEVGLAHVLHTGKGCYPGQEVIEKIISLGSPPRRLAILTGEGPAPQTPAPITSGGADAGTLTSAAADPATEGWVGLGLLKKNQWAKAGAENAFEVGGTAATAHLKGNE